MALQRDSSYVSTLPSFIFSLFHPIGISSLISILLHYFFPFSFLVVKTFQVSILRRRSIQLVVSSKRRCVTNRNHFLIKLFYRPLYFFTEEKLQILLCSQLSFHIISMHDSSFGKLKRISSCLISIDSCRVLVNRQTKMILRTQIINIQSCIKTILVTITLSLYTCLVSNFARPCQ